MKFFTLSALALVLGIVFVSADSSAQSSSEVSSSSVNTVRAILPVSCEPEGFIELDFDTLYSISVTLSTDL